MTKGRLEAFSDGVVAILITIMVLELRAPRGTSLAALGPMMPTFLCYVLSFVFIGIYWSNHHHLIQAVHRVNGAILWANLHLLFWLSLVPFTTSWMGQSHAAPAPVAAYGVVLLAAAFAYHILTWTLVAHHGCDSAIAKAVGHDAKAAASELMYAAGVGLAFVRPSISCALYVAMAVIWLVPDRRIERALRDRQ